MCKILQASFLIPNMIETYFEKKKIITIKKFTPVLKVIPSKQQPRKLVIQGLNLIDKFKMMFLT